MRILGTENSTLQKAMHEQVPHMALHRAMLFQRSRMSCAKKHENLLEGAVPLRGSPPIVTPFGAPLIGGNYYW